MRWFVAFVAMSAALSASFAATRDVLINGDFEQTKEIGSHDPGPGWYSNPESVQDFTVVGPDGWWQDARPFGGQRAMGVASNSLIDEGTLEQTVRLDPGRYRVVITGHAWIFDNLGGDGLESYIDPRFYVDGRLIRSRRLTGPGPKQWFPIRIEWTGNVVQEVRLALNARGDGRGPDTWGVVVIDDWRMEVETDPKPPETVLLNGDFEQAGPTGSDQVGPGWITRGRPQVFSFGTIHEYVPDFAPYDGEKAIGVIANTMDDSCTIEQSAPLDPGFYELTLSGHLFLWDTFGGDHYNSYAEVYFAVDDRDVQYKRVWCASPRGPQRSWGDLEWTWSGYVSGRCGVHIDLQARGAGDLKSWGLCAADGWRISAKPLATSPEAENRLVNGGFEQSGPIDNRDPGPGWTASGTVRVLGPVDIFQYFPIRDPYDTFFRSHPPLAPRSGEKAMGILCNSVDESGALEQTVVLEPGDYELTVTGYVWQWDTWGGGDYDPYVIACLLVDGATVAQQRIGYDEEEYPEHWWGRVRQVWNGPVKGAATVRLTIHALGAGPAESWAASAVDDWMLVARPSAARKP